MLLQSFRLVSPSACLFVIFVTSFLDAGFCADKHPNVLFIAIDDLRPELKCYGSKQIKSPNIDRFAASGMMFERAYCQQAVCNPSRTSLMTGLRPDTIGVTGNHIHFRSNKPDVVTLPQHFKNHGYFAQAIGKLYHGVFLDGCSNTKWDTMGDPQSWSVPATRFGPRYYYTEEGIAAARATYQRVYKPKNPGPNDWTEKLVFGPATESPNVADNQLYDGKVADSAIKALQELKQTPDQPFFLAVGFIKPHSPYIAPKKYFDLYDNVDLATDQNLPDGAPAFAGHGSGELRRYTDQPGKGPISEEKQKRVRQAYYACVSYIDAQIGRVLDELDRLGLAENTIVSLYGDHGYHLGEQGLWGKTTNFELDTRVPLIVRVPGMETKGQTSNSLVELVDLYPTLSELAGLPVGGHLEGKSFVPILKDPTAQTKGVALSQYPRGGGLMGYSMRTATERMTHWVNAKTGEIRATEFYDYSDGSQIETKNVASDANHKTRIATMSKRLFKSFGLGPFPVSTTVKNKIKVACVGDSITFGSGIKDRANNSYPALLQKMLGDGYEVGNFGYSGATLLKKGHKPFWEKAPYPNSLEFNPDIVVINLGANDVVDMNWKHAGEFEADYRELIECYRELPSKPKVYICEILPIFPNHGRYKECTVNRKQLVPLVRKVARKSKTKLIDLHSPFADKNDLFPDGLHPNESGAKIMAEHVFVTLTGKKVPAVAIAVPPAFNDENGTSFEETKPGSFDSIVSKVGTWELSAGNAEIDNKHAKTGNQCLHLAGAEETVVELALAKNIKPDGQLSFWAERWTSRGPFEFRIAKRTNGKWTEVFNGDKKVAVGRAFKSNVMVPLGDPNITHLRFSVTSPPNTGILIDDLKIAPATPQRITNVEVVPVTLPALVGTQASALLKLKVETEGVLNPIAVTELTATLAGTTDRKDLESIQVYYSGASSNFSSASRFGNKAAPKKELVFSSKQSLAEGANYFWIACTLNKKADIDHRVGAACTQIEFSDGTKTKLTGAPSIQQIGVAVRNGGDDGVHTYRIPGLATTNKGTLIGVYDVRNRGGGDLPGDIDVGMSRSTDGGRTWDPMKVIMDMGDDPKWNGDGIGDPAVLVDRETGTIWASATWSHGNRSWRGSGPGLEPEETGQWILVKSDDDGNSWSAPINITKQVKKPEWSFLLQGPGKGITLANGTIVFPAQYQDPPNASDKKANRLPHSTFIYSRDHGKNWSVGTGAWDDTTEAQVVELDNGEIMINCRNNRASKRAVMTTTDMGKTWQQHSTHIKDLIEPGSCMASLINVGRELSWRNLSGANNEFLLFSNPDSLRGRNHMTIKASLDSGKTWQAENQLLLDEQGGRGYSCMSMIDSETVGILYEGSQAHMTFQRVKLADILNPPADQKTKNPAQASVTPVPKKSTPPNSISFARPFGDHMVLQSDHPIRVWGSAKPGSDVSVGFKTSGDRTPSKANANGDWMVELPAQPANADPQALIATSEGVSIQLDDVLFGEVWICAGQSNMEFQLSKSASAKTVIAKSSDPLFRLHNCPGGARGGSGVYTEKLMQRLVPSRFSDGQWEVAAPDTTGEFSAVGYFFAQRLREELDVPVGLINVSVGGTPIESWISPARLKQDPHLSRMFDGNWLDNPLLDEWCKGRARSNLKRGLAGELNMPEDEYGPNHSFKPGFMYQAGIKPFEPLSLRGGLWYQGESNGDNPARTKLYDACFPLLVDDWRASFRNPGMPVAFVQLPAMGRPNWPVFREYQRRSLSNLTNVGMAITIDTGHPSNVHPAEKKPVGDRLAQWALVNVYEKPGLPMGPLFRSKATKRKSLLVSFDYVGDSLKTRDGADPTHFEIAGPDGIYHPAKAVIKNRQIMLTANDVPKPVDARYAWQPFPKPFPNLVNSDGLPASPFSTEETVPEG